MTEYSTNITVHIILKIQH